MVEGLSSGLAQSPGVKAQEATLIYLEIVNGAGPGKAWQFPVRLKSLAPGEGILEGSQCPDELDIRELVGQKAIIHTPAFGEAPLSQVRGRVLWTRPGAGPDQNFLLGLRLEEGDFKVPQVWQEQLSLHPGDLQDLWDLWDRVHEEQRNDKSDQTFYLLGTLGILGGLILGFFGPESASFWGILAAIYGSLVIGGKSLYSLWRNRGKSREPDKFDQMGD